jgi:FkbM family methyltransferase
VERHKTLKRIARVLYIIPGLRTAVRLLVRLAVQSLFLSLKNKQRLYNFFAEDTSPSHDVICTTNLPYAGLVKLSLNLHDDLSRRWYYCGYSGYETGTVRLVCKLLESRRCVFDIGANVGYYTLLVAAALEGRGEVHAFEPCPRVFQWLARNAQLNGLSCVFLNQAALSDVDGHQRLFLPADFAGTNASLMENFTAQDGFVMTPTLRFDSYCRTKVTQPVDLIKIDAEGAELSVLYGAGDLIDQWLPDLICEVLEPFEKDLDKFFASRPYRKFLITDTGLQETERILAHSQYRDYYLRSAGSRLEESGMCSFVSAI